MGFCKTKSTLIVARSSEIDDIHFKSVTYVSLPWEQLNIYLM